MSVIKYSSNLAKKNFIVYGRILSNFHSLGCMVEYFYMVFSCSKIDLKIVDRVRFFLTQQHYTMRLQRDNN